MFWIQQQKITFYDSVKKSFSKYLFEAIAKKNPSGLGLCFLKYVNMTKPFPLNTLESKLNSNFTD